MIDNDLDTMLREHGATWRAAHEDRPGIDWNGVTQPRRVRAWLAIAGVAVAAAAVIVPVAITVGDSGAGTDRPGRPVASPTPVNPNDLTAGSPQEYFGIRPANRGIVYVSKHAGRGGTTTPVKAIGGVHHDIVYTARESPACQARLDLTFYPPWGNGVTTSGQPQHVATVDGQPVPTPMAVTAQAGTLAMVVVPPHHGAGYRTVPCSGPEQIVLIDLHTGTEIARTSVSNSDLTIDSLAWTADGTALIYRLQPDIYRTGPISKEVAAASGTHVMTVAGVEAAMPLESSPRLLPLQAHGDGPTYGPVISWHGVPAVFFDGDLYRLDGNEGLGAVVATGFTGKVDTASSDKTGEHLLLGAGGRSYRWDYGTLIQLPGHLSQPTW
jgi:hypothetical protein